MVSKAVASKNCCIEGEKDGAVHKRALLESKAQNVSLSKLLKIYFINQRLTHLEIKEYLKI